MKTDLEVLNDFLIRIANAEKVGIRKKIVILERYLKAFKKRKTNVKMLPGVVYAPYIPECFKNTPNIS